MWRRVLSVVFCVLTASAAVADDAHARLSAAFDAWLAKADTQGQIATALPGPDGLDLVRTGSGMVELASVSKSVTALCVLDLVEAGRLDWSDRLPDLLGEAPDVTVAQLITHSGGLAPDNTQGVMALWLNRATPDSAHFSAQVLRIVNARTTQEATPGTYHYNNENYALLGLVIEAVTGAPYLDHCRQALDLGDGIAASPHAMAMQPWGGLMAEPAAHLAFLHRHFGPDSAVGQNPFAYPHVPTGGGAYYGLGMAFRAHGDGHNFWHFGAWCFPDRFNQGSFAVIWQDKAAALAAYDACVSWDMMFELDAALVGAVYGGVQ